MPIPPQTRRLRRAVLADTTALLLFFTTTGILDAHVIAGMTAEEVLHARLLGATVLMLGLGRLDGTFLGWVGALFGLSPGRMRPVGPDP